MSTASLFYNLDTCMRRTGPEKEREDISHKANQIEVWKKNLRTNDRLPRQYSHHPVFAKTPEANVFPAGKSFQLQLNRLPSVHPKHHIGLFSLSLFRTAGPVQTPKPLHSTHLSYNEKPRYRKWHFWCT